MLDNLIKMPHFLHDVDYATSAPTTGMRWHLCAHRGATSDRHMDAGGFATFIQPVTGGKIWILRVQRAAAPNKSNGRWQKTNTYEYIALYLAPGDFLWVQISRPL